MPNPSRSDLSLINSNLKRYKDNLQIDDNQNAFYYLVLELIFGLQEDEIEDSITDNYYLSILSPGDQGHDRGIDAIYINEDDNPPTIHLFNFKYTNKFEKLGSNYPSVEVDKVASFISDLMGGSADDFKNINNVLMDKVNDIWKLLEVDNPRFVMHFCSNQYAGFEQSELHRLEAKLKRYSVKLELHLMDDLVGLITRRDRIVVNGKIRAIDKRFFKSLRGIFGR